MVTLSNSEIHHRPPFHSKALRLILGDLATRNAAIAREESGPSESSTTAEGMRPVQVRHGRVNSDGISKSCWIFGWFNIFYRAL